MLKLPSRLLAEYGEYLAKRHILRKGYKLLTTNWRLKHGELDIVAIDKQELVFIEVKTRKAVKNNDFPPGDAVDYRKINKIKNIADFYMERNQKMMQNMKINHIRYDVIGISVWSPLKFEIDHRIDAFE